MHKKSSGSPIAGRLTARPDSSDGPRRAFSAYIYAPILVAALALFCVIFVAPASANMSFTNGTPSVTYGSTVPGAHSDVTVDAEFGYTGGDDLKNIIVDMPAGLYGNPMAVPAASRCNVAYPGGTYGGCPASSRVGTINVTVTATVLILPTQLALSGDVYLLRNQPSASPEVPTHLGIHIEGILNIIGNVDLTGEITVRNDTDFGLRFKIMEDSPRSVALLAIRMDQMTMTLLGMPNGQPFMTNPTRCDAWTTQANVRAYDGNSNANADLDPAIAGNDYVRGSSTTTPTGCPGSLGAFNPSGAWSTTETQAGAPAGLRLTLGNAIGTPQSAHVKRLDISLPDGYEINPALTLDATVGCTDAQFNRASANTADTCPASTKIADVTVGTPLLSTPITGAIFLGQPGVGLSNRYRLFMSLDDPANAVKAKLEGRAFVDNATGQVTSVFGDPAVDDFLPQFLWSSFQMDFKSGPRSMVTNPVGCGSHAGSVVFTPWTSTNQGTVTRNSNVSMSYDGAGAPCPGSDPFNPTLNFGVSTTVAGAHPDVTIGVTLPAKNQQIDHASFSLPTGMGGSVAGTTQCTQANAAAGTCAAGSIVGSVVTQVGSAADLVTINGSLYNTVPNAGSPARLTAIVPVLVGPFDLGNVIVPVDISLRPDFGLDATTGTIPTRLQGIPVRMRQLTFTMNGTAGGQPFMTNPSKCQVNTLNASITSTVPTTVARSGSYTTTGCPRTTNPSITTTVSTSSTKLPTGFTFGLTLPSYDPPAESVHIDLPVGMDVNPVVGNGLAACTAADIDAGGSACAAGSVVGTVAFTTPLLGGTWSGNVYLETPGATPATRYKIAFVAHLPGRDLIAHGSVQVNGSGLGIDSGTGRVSVDFPTLPDIYWSSFTMALNSGDRAMLTNPATCGVNTTSAQITPKTTGGVPVTRSATFNTSFDGAGGACPANEPFTPTFGGSVSTTAAGGHPNLTMTVTRGEKQQQLRDLNIHLPSGLVATAPAIPQCTQANAAAGNCAPGTQVGTLTTSVGTGIETYSLSGTIHNTAPNASEPARLTAIVPVVVGPFDLGVMSLPIPTSLRGDYGVDTQTAIPLRYEGVPVRVRSLSMTINGVVGGVNFMTNPSKCQSNVVSADMISSVPTTATGSFSYMTTGCPMPFNPSFSASISTTETAKPTGLTFGISLPNGNSTLKRAQVVLPAGMEINPAVGNGPLTACSTAAIDAGGAACPATSHQGAVTLNTPLLAVPATGNVYLETPGATPATRYRLAIVIHLPGRDLILRGSAQVDGSGAGADNGTGRVTADFDNIPDLGFSNMTLAFNSGNRALLTNPAACGTQTVSADLTPNSTGGVVATRTATFITSHDGIGAACPASDPFAPTFTGSVSTTQAGGHPDLTMTVNRTDKNQQLRNMNLHLPTGLVANTSATPQCTQANAAIGNCAAATRIGSVTTAVGSGAETYSLSGGIHNTVPSAGEPARLTAIVPVVVGPFDLGKLSLPVSTALRGDFGIDASTQLPLRFEGVPVRVRSLQMVLNGIVGGNSFMTNPSTCQSNSIVADMVSPTPSTVTGVFSYTTTGCPITFNPSISASVLSSETAKPTGLTFGISVPADHSTLKSVQMTLPPGMDINPAAGNGPLAACSTAAIDAGGATCPATSNQGTVTLNTPLLPAAQTGNVYLETPGATPAMRYKLAIVIHLPGRDLVLHGNVQVNGSGGGADSGTGRVTADFGGIPDLGFSNMTLAFNTGNRSLLTNPATCGAQTVSADLTPNTTGGPVATRTASFTTSYNGVGGECPATDPFAPTFTGSVSTTQAGGHPDLTLSVTRPDKHQALRNVNFHLPAGLVATSPAVPRCTQAAAATATCAPASQVGTLNTSVGSGAETLALNGAIYNTEPDPTEPARLTAVVPVVVGPFDLGTMSIPVTTSLRADYGVDTATQLPLRYEGVPVRIRSMSMVIDGIVGGSEFMTNPSTCQINVLSADMVAPSSTTATSSFSYATTGCPTAFNPSITATVSSGETEKPAGLTLGINVPDGNSTLKRTQITLPAGMEINPAVGNGPLTACSTAAIDAGGATCPATSNQGAVTLNTPLLGAPATGNVYLETPGATPATRYKLAIVVHLPGRDLIVHGSAQVDGSGSIDSGTGRVTADFDNIPDLAFSSLSIAFNTGDRALLTNPASCGTQTVSANLTPNTTGGPVATRTAGFTTSYDGAGGACPASESFTPAFSGAVSTTAAGGHPDLTLTVTRPNKHKSLRNLNLHLPVGLVATSTAVPQCSQASASAGTCTAASRVGTVSTSVGSGAETLNLTGWIHNTVPSATEPARLTAIIPIVVGPFDLGMMSVPVTTSLRSDYGVDTATQLPLRYEGVPVRIRSMSLAIDGIVAGNDFMTNPSNCQSNTLAADMVAPDTTTVTGSFSYSTTGCPTAFDPSISASVSDTETAKPTGLTFGIGVPNGHSTLQRVQMTLPAGMEINPAVGNGPLTACSTAAIDAGGATCPATSSQGTVTLITPLLGSPATGNLYLETPGATPSTRYKLAIVVHLPGHDLVIHGSAQVDGSGTGTDTGSGRVTADFGGIPDLAFSTMTVAFNTGDRALLTNPVSCGSQTVSADLTPNTTGGAVVTRTANFMTSYDGAGAGCPANDPFAPTFSGSVSTTAAGAHPDLTLTVDRSDKNQQLRNFNVHLPVGLVANTSAVPRCSQANAAAGNCLAANAVGSVTTGVGSGDQTYTLGGTIYNTTPNASEPARLTAVVPVVVGPYDLGKLSLPVTTSLRGDLGVDASTQLPLRFEGVPVRIQSMQMVLNGNVGGNDFMTNPSKCQSNVVTADMISPAAQSVSGSFSYATTACPTSFNPSISASVSSTETAKPTGLTFGVTIPADDSTLGRLQLTLPAGMEINPAAGNGPLTACSTAAIDAGGATCPATSNQGTVTMATPLLGSAVTGNVYLETPGATPATRYKLAIVLHLPGRDLVIRGAVQVDGSGAGADSGTGRVTADFNNIPDLAFTAMDVAFNTGNRALLSNPIACGAHTVSADLTPNSTGGSVATRTANITTSFDGTGGACPANEPFTPNFSGSVSTTQAGGHPDLTLTVTRPNKTEQLRNFNLHLPSGLVATSTAVTRCSQASAAAGTCAAASRVGTVTTSVGSGAETLSLSGAIHNTEPDASEPARLTAIVSVVVGPFDLGTMSLPVTTSLRGDYGVDTATELPLRYEGVPVRIRSISMVIDGVVGGNDFMTNPSNCQPHTLTADMVAPDSTTVTGSFSYTTSGCPTAFDPSISAAVSTTETAKPTGLTFGISVPSGNSTVKRVQMTLPAGMEINPAAGNGPLTACSTAAIDAGGATCPATSNQGTVTLNTPLLGAPATGNVYLETPGATPSTRYKLGVVIHLPGQELILHGSVQVDGSGSGADAGTGRVTADFDNIPDLSFSSLSIAFNTGNRALLTNPVGCGAQAVSADLTPHTTGGSVATRTATFTTSHDGAGAACPASAPFAPTFTGSVSTTQAGGHPDLTLTVNRTDKNQQLRNFNVHLPVGLVATSPAVPQCAQSDATAGNCAVATEVGTVTTSVGSGSETYALSGTIHNTVPGASEPARLTATIPVVVGPFDLGKLSLPVTTGLRAGDYGVDASTQLPLRFEGVPVRIRDMSMTIDGVVGGANFMTNPSKCQVNTVSADMVSPSSSTATGSFNYTTTACPTTFNPSITASVSSTETATPTGLTFGIGLPAGDSTLKRVQMTLPAGMEINPAAGNGPLAACTTAAINAGGAACPPSSNQGTVTMVTPLLGGPQTGNVYLETPGATPSTRYKLAIVVHLPGSELVIRGAVQVDGSGAGADSGTGRVTADFDDVPDLGFSSLTVAFNTGHRALLTNPAVCGLQTVSADLTPHSTGGAVATRTDSFTTSYDGAGAACPGSEPFAPTFSGAVSTTQAGGHPDLLFTVNRGDKTQQLRNFNIHLPVGLVASTSAADQCTQANAASGNCAADTRVGSVTTSVGTGGETYALAGTIHNTVPGASEPARLTAVVPVVVGPFNFGKLSLPITTSLRGDLGVDTATQLPLRFEGIPVRVRDMSIQIDGIGPQGPFTVNPSKCQLNTVTADMAAPGGATATGSFSFTTTGCPASFNPALSVSVDTTETAKPVGLTIGIGVPYGDSSLKHVQMSLPAGMELNPAIGNGPLQACDLATIDAGGSGCPATSNLGTVTLNTPLLPAPQTGNIYLETPGATPATRYKMAIVIHLPGQDLVVHGSAQVNGSGGGSDSGTGQVTAEFDNLPDIQFTNLQVSFKTGSRALLTNPVTCGAHTMGAGLTPHTTGGPTANRTASFSTSYNGSGAACPGADPQNPSFTASLSTYQAGDHPDVTIDIVRPDKDQNIRKLKVMLPNGLVGDADAAPTCSQTDADAGSCATNSQVGTIGIDVGSGSETYHLDGTINNTVAASNRPAKLTATIPVNVGPFDFGKVVVPIDVNLNPDDYSLEATTGDMPTRFEGIPVRIRAMHMVLAGVVDPDGPGGAAANAFMSNPRTCSALNVRADITSPLGSTVRKTAPLPLPITGCESLALAGSIDITNSTSTAWTPTALGVQLNLPPAANQATLRKLVLALPGFRLNAPGANGLTACTATQLTAQICPANSQVGTAWLDTSLLPIDGGTGHSLTGKVYLETPGNSAADRYKLAVQLSGKTTITLRGTAVVDETTGEMTTVFDNLPDIPFDAFRVDLTGAANPILLNPQSCGISAAAATLTPWSASSSTDDVTLAKNLTINGCTTHGFAPTNSVTLSTSNAGAHPDAQFVIDRPDGDQDLKSVSVSLPPGFLGSAAAVPQCAVAAAQAAGCSAASKVGSIEAKVGTGTNVLTLPGDVYLTAGQGGDIAGMAMRIPAIAGPYNLGDVVALGRINLRPSDHGLDVTFDDIPRIFKGVPTQLQRLKLNLAGTASSGKPFLYNASNCAAAQINTTFGSYDGGSATSGSPYQPTACGSRPFNPKLEIVGTGGNTTIAPAWLMKMTMPDGNATLRRANVLLPTVMTVNILGLNGLCEVAQADAWACPEHSRIGTAAITTPLLPGPVNGSVYVARGTSTLPDLMIMIGAPFNIQIRGANRFINNIQIQSTFDNLPDLIWSEMSMNITGGAKGLIGLRAGGACGDAKTTFGGHGGEGIDKMGPVTGISACSNALNVCDKPSVIVATRGAKKAKFKNSQMSVMFSSAAHCSAVKSFTMLLPKGTKIDKRMLKKGKNITGRAGSDRLKGKAFAMSGKTGLKIKSKLPADTHGVTLKTVKSLVKLPYKSFCGNIKGKSRTAKAKMNKCKKKTVSFTFVVTRADGSVLKFVHKVKAGDRRFK